jgi:hypothetical protein
MSIKRKRALPTDNFETDFIDIDKLFDLYIEQFKALRLQLQMKYQKIYYRILGESKTEGPTCQKIHDYSKDLRYKPKLPVEMLEYPGRISILRTICYAYMSGNNNNDFDKDGFMTACTQFGLNCPNPCVVRRLAYYGNPEDVMKAVVK